MLLLSCHNIHVVVLVVTIHSNKQAHIIAHCETNYETKQNERKQNKGIKSVVFKSSRLPESRKRDICLLVLDNNTTPAGYKSFVKFCTQLYYFCNRT